MTEQRTRGRTATEPTPDARQAQPEATPKRSEQPGYHDTKRALSRRLKRIEGQVRGIEKMIDEDRYCIDVITQISAVQSGMKAVALALLDDHMSHCVVEAARAGGDAQDVKLAEVNDAIARLMRA